MKNKLICCLLAGSLIAGTTFAAGKKKSAAGADKPVTLTLWSFVQVHTDFYKTMAAEWNAQHPDEKINLVTTVLPYEDMHNKLTTTLQSAGAPDICDVEIGKFSNYMKGVPQLVSLNKYLDPYRSTVVKSRLAIYAKNGVDYGVPTHVGATVMYYNTELLKKAGIDYTKIVTWDDYRAAGAKLKSATGKTMGFAETRAAWTFSALLTQQGSDLTDSAGNAALTSTAAVNAATLMQNMVKDGTLVTCPGGQPDSEEGKGYIAAGNVASVLMPLWYMSRFVNEMPDNAGKWAIAPVPVMKKGQPRSLGLGGTGTVVTKQSKNADLASKFIVWAKLSPEGEKHIWSDLGFDPVNTKLWSDSAFTHDPSNQYVKYFLVNPFDVLNTVKNEIELVKNTPSSPDINSVLTTVTLNELFIDKKNPADAMKEAQETVLNNMQ